MDDLNAEFQSYLETHKQKKDFQLQKDFEAHLKDRAQGGSIRQGYPEDANENPPYGAVVGGVAGGVAGGALLGPAGAMIGAAAGAAGGQFVQGRIEMATKDKLAPRSFDDELYRMQREGTINLAFEGAGRGVAWLVPKVRALAPYAGSVTPEAIMAQQNLERMTGVQNPYFMPAEMTSSRVLDILHNVSEYSLLGGGAIKEFKDNRDVFYTNLSRAILSRYGATMQADDVGRAVVDSAKYNLEMAKAPAKFLYEAIESQAAPQYAKAPARITVKKETDAITQPTIKKMKVTKQEGEAEGAAQAAPQAKESEAFGESLITFLRNKGGVRDKGGEIGRLEIKGKPGQKGLIKQDGMDLDTAAAIAQEAGYLPDRDINKLLEAIESESRGKPVYSHLKGNEAKQGDIFQKEFEGQFGPDDMQAALDAEPELRGMQVKTTWQDIQVGEQLKRMKVMVTEQENQIGGTRIDLSSIKKEFEQDIKTAKVAGGLADQPMGNTLMAFLDKKPDYVSYPVAKAIRTEIRTLRDVLARTPETKNVPAIRQADRLYKSITKQIREGLADDDPFLAQMWDEANLIEAGANRQFNTKFINELVKLAEERGGNAPEAIVEKVWNPKRVTQMQVVRNAVSPENWRKMQQIEMEQMWKQAMPDGVPDSHHFKRAFFGENDEKLSMLEAGFDRATVKELKEFHQALKIAQEKQSEGTGRVLVQLQQGRYGAEAVAAGLYLMGMYGDDDPKFSVMAGGVILAPWMLGKLFTHPSGIKWLTEGLSTSPKTARGIALWSQIAKVVQGGVPRTQEAPATNTPLQQLQNVP